MKRIFCSYPHLIDQITYTENIGYSVNGAVYLFNDEDVLSELRKIPGRFTLHCSWAFLARFVDLLELEFGPDMIIRDNGMTIQGYRAFNLKYHARRSYVLKKRSQRKSELEKIRTDSKYRDQLYRIQRVYGELPYPNGWVRVIERALAEF